MNEKPVAVIGAGPAGLAAGYELARQNVPPIVLERDSKVGGISRTEEYKGFFFDIGGHRFFTKNQDISQLWQAMMGEDFLQVDRLSRIYYSEKSFVFLCRHAKSPSLE